MSKKIIYLLSLLMALSLVFASCKKNGITGVQGNLNQEDETHTKTGGLIDTWDNLKNKTIINDYGVVGETGGDYYRNPVIVALGGPHVLIVTEKRIEFEGSANDIGVNGDKPVDIVYLLSNDGGDTFKEVKVVGDSSKGDGANKAVSAPVVYYNKPENADTAKIYIIASAGAGISRTDKPYTSRNVKSELKYAVGSISGLSTDTDIVTINWNGGWKKLAVTDPNPKSVQFGTHSGRGIFADSDLILPIITADQGVNGNPGQNAAHEMMGVVFYKVTGTSGTTLSLGNKIGTQISFDEGTTTKFSVFKEAEAVAWNNGTLDYLVVPSPANSKTKMGTGKAGTSSAQVSETTITGSEGSFGFLSLKGSWYGAGEYDPSKYVKTPTQAGPESGASGSDAKLFSHVTSQAGENYLRLLSIEGYAPINTKALRIAKTGKSSSIDVLPDGTIIMAAEKERNYAAAGLKFTIFFSRYTQSYLASQLAD